MIATGYSLRVFLLLLVFIRILWFSDLTGYSRLFDREGTHMLLAIFKIAAVVIAAVGVVVWFVHFYMPAPAEGDEGAE